MANEEQDATSRRSHLTPLLSERLNLSTPPPPLSSSQALAKDTERPSKTAARRQPGDVRIPMSFSRKSRTSREIFSDEVTEPSRSTGVQQVEEKKRKQDVDESAGPYCQIRKRAAERAHDVSPMAHFSQKKAKMQGRKVPSGRRSLKRAASTQVVLASCNSLPAPPNLLQSRASEHSIDVARARSALLEPLLPTVYSSRHPDLNIVTPRTVAKVLRGEFQETLAGFELLDCRFPFEFQGGSLRGASSLCDPDEMEAKLFVSAHEQSTRTALIFFCEFSANRAPKMLRHVRNVDRRLHAESYPELYYPELYLIDGGYKHCFETLEREVFAPASRYVRMEDESFTEECRSEFAAWRRRWKPHKTVANCAAKLETEVKQLDACGIGQSRSDISQGVRSLFEEL